MHIDESIRNFEPLRGGNECLVLNLSGDISQYWLLNLSSFGTVDVCVFGFYLEIIIQTNRKFNKTSVTFPAAPCIIGTQRPGCQ